MTLHLKIILLASLSGATAATLMSPAAAAGAAYCVAQSGPNGENSFVGNCNFSSYQQCVASTVGSNGDCVGNVDFRPTDNARAELVVHHTRHDR
ncbi:DUF3551 domain-containing protein [Tardiphaga sp. 866_E4_N1_4]